MPRTAPPRAVETRRTSSDVTEVRLTLLSFDITWSLTYYSHSAIFVKRTLRSGGASGLSCSSGEAEHFRRARRPPIYITTPHEKSDHLAVWGAVRREEAAPLESWFLSTQVAIVVVRERSHTGSVSRGRLGSLGNNPTLQLAAVKLNALGIELSGSPWLSHIVLDQAPRWAMSQTRRLRQGQTQRHISSARQTGATVCA